MEDIVFTIAATNSASTSKRFTVGSFSRGSFIAPTGVTSVAFYSATTQTDTPAVIRDRSNTAVTMTVTAGESYQLPAECFSHWAVVLVLTGSASATVTITASDRPTGAATNGTVTVNSGTNTIGGVRDAGPSVDGTQTYTTSADMSTAAAITAAPGSGKKVRVTDLLVWSAVSMTFTLEMETSGTDLYVLYLSANGPPVQLTLRDGIDGDTADKKIMGKASVAGTVHVLCNQRDKD